MNDFKDLGGNLFADTRRVDDGKPFRLGMGELKETIAQTAMERFACAFDPIGRCGRRRLAFRKARPRGFRGNIKENCQVGHEPFRGEIVELAQERHIDAAAVTLIGKGGIGKTVADHPLAACESGTNDVGNNLGARGEEQEHLATRHRRIFHFFAHEPANELGQSRSARFTRYKNGMPLGTQLLGEQLNVCRLAAPFGPLERYEPTSHFFVTV